MGSNQSKPEPTTCGDFANLLLDSWKKIAATTAESTKLIEEAENKLAGDFKRLTDNGRSPAVTEAQAKAALSNAKSLNKIFTAVSSGGRLSNQLNKVWYSEAHSEGGKMKFSKRLVDFATFLEQEAEKLNQCLRNAGIETLSWWKRLCRWFSELFDDKETVSKKRETPFTRLCAVFHEQDRTDVLNKGVLEIGNECGKMGKRADVRDIEKIENAIKYILPTYKE